MADDKITVRFESQLNSPENDELLLSGPVDIFATVDNFYELTGKSDHSDSEHQDHPTAEEMEVYKELKSSIQKAFQEGRRFFVVFCKDVRDELKSEEVVPGQTNRGAYFRLMNKISYGETSAEDTIDLSGDLIWQEVLLGTHSHHNLDILESLTPAYKAELDGLLEQKDTQEDIRKELAETLPEDFLEKKNQLEAYRNLMGYYLDTTPNRLDAPLDDPNPNALGTCRDLYRSLIKADPELYIKPDGSLWWKKDSLTAEENAAFIREHTFGKINLHTDIVNFSGENLEPHQVEAIQDKFYSFRYSFGITTNWDYDILLEEGLRDHIFIYAKNLGETEYKYIYDRYDVHYDSKTKDIIVSINKDVIGNGITEINLLFVQYNTALGADRATFDNEIALAGKLDVDDIKSQLRQLYIRGSYNRKPDLPRLYLSTNDNGEVEWSEGMFAGSTFVKSTLLIDDKYLESHVIHSPTGDVLKLEFDIEYDQNVEYAIVMINEGFLFDAAPIASGKKTVVAVSMDRLEESITLRLNEDIDNIATLLLLKRITAKGISEELGKEYITRKDAIAILSHGKLNLEDYAKKGDFDVFAKSNHHHSEYAMKNHDHDYRYANFHHTHPELLALIAKELGGDITAEQLQAWLDGIDERYKNAITSTLSAWAFDDKQIALDDETCEALNEATAKYNFDDKLTGGVSTLGDGLRLIAKLIKCDFLLTDQVLLKEDIYINLKNGPIGGLDEDRIRQLGGKYEKGTDIDIILRDILNPSMSALEVKKKLTPVSIELQWFTKNDAGEFEEIEHGGDEYILSQKYDDSILYFKPKSKYCGINSDGEECKIEGLNLEGTMKLQRTEIKIVNDPDSEAGYVEEVSNGETYYKYLSGADIKGSISIPEIKYTYTTDQLGAPEGSTDGEKTELGHVFDTYWISSVKLNDPKTYSEEDYPENLRVETDPKTGEQYIVGTVEVSFKIATPLIYFGTSDRLLFMESTEQDYFVDENANWEALAEDEAATPGYEEAVDEELPTYTFDNIEYTESALRAFERFNLKRDDKPIRRTLDISNGKKYVILLMNVDKMDPKDHLKIVDTDSGEMISRRFKPINIGNGIKINDALYVGYYYYINLDDSDTGDYDSDPTTSKDSDEYLAYAPVDADGTMFSKLYDLNLEFSIDDVRLYRGGI